MNFPLDIHAHHTVVPGSAIINCYPETFSESAEGWFSVGIHPWKIDAYGMQLPYSRLRSLLVRKEVVAIGETGLDKLCQVSLDKQEAVFRRHIELAEEVGKPVILHVVKAIDELLRLKKQLRPSTPWIIHGFRGKPAQARQLLSHGLSLSFGALYHPESLQVTPVNRLFFESDEVGVSVTELIARAALLRNVPAEELTEIVQQNVKRVFFAS